jgi:hypothetical protein
VVFRREQASANLGIERLGQPFVSQKEPPAATNGIVICPLPESHADFPMGTAGPGLCPLYKRRDPDFFPGFLLRIFREFEEETAGTTVKELLPGR